MEIGGNSSRKHSGSNWEIRDLNRCSGSSSSYSNKYSLKYPTTAQPIGSEPHAVIFPPILRQQLCYSSLYGAGGGKEGASSSQYPPDPHLMCLKLGKRQYYFEDNTTHLSASGSQTPVVSMGKRGKPYYVGVAPRCQVEDCNAELVEAKDYHRRHKVCEIHSKAPMVIVLGLQQRFCQQCSRFHLVSEFDDTKRSCRRRLAGHNERRRKSSNESVSRNFSQGCAHSLLSSKSNKWDFPSDLSSRSKAALCELIAEHRAATLARRVFEQNLHNHHTFQELADQDQPAVGDSSSFLLPPASHA